MSQPPCLGHTQTPGQPYIVHQRRVCVRLGQEELDNGQVSMLSGTHEGCGAVIILDIDLCPGRHQHLYHVQAAVGHRQHQCRLPVLEWKGGIVAEWILKTLSVILYLILTC